MKNQNLLKLFVVLLFSTAFIFSFSHFGAQAIGNLTNSDGKFMNGTSIGFLDVSGKTKSEVSSMLEGKYIDWLKETQISLEYQEMKVPFDLNQFHLDSQQTIDSIKDGQKNIAFIVIDKAKVKEQIQLLFPQLNSSDFDIDKLTTTLTQTASKFETSTFHLNLYNDFLLTDHMKNDVEINTADLQLTRVSEDLQGVLEKIPMIEIPGGTGFSLLGFINEKKLKVQADTLNILATSIYQVILPTNIQIAERNISNSLPHYAKLGYEAKVNVGQQADLSFYNPNKGKFILELKLENSHLVAALKGEKLLYDYKISMKDNQKLTPKTIIQYSPLLDSGKTLIQNNGVDGQIVKVYRDIYQGNQFVKSELISEDYYPPVNRVEIHALDSNPNSTENPNGTQDGTAPGNQTGPDGSNKTETQPTSGTIQQNSNESDLWGKTNEQPK